MDAKASATLAVSAALTHASKTTHEILDAHEASASVDDTVQKLHQVWHPVCKEMGCDHRCFLDIHLASHGQTVSLMQLDSAKRVRREIQQCLWLEQRVFQFVEANAHYFGVRLWLHRTFRRFIRTRTLIMYWLKCCCPEYSSIIAWATGTVGVEITFECITARKQAQKSMSSAQDQELELHRPKVHGPGFHPGLERGA